VTAAEFTEGDYGPHYEDQLEMYASLIDDDDVTDEELTKYFHSMQFGPGTEPEDEYEVRTGVTVYRDDFGIPHIYADSFDGASFALGYVSAEDRMFQMDIFRHAARGTLAGFLGPGRDDAYLKMDIDTRREGYTQEEVQKMFDDFDDKFGATGVILQKGLEEYAAGINAYNDEHAMDPSRRPFEYEATGNPYPGDPEEWTAVDTLFIAILQLRVFGETAGGEISNAGFYQNLIEKHGKKRGTALFDSFLFQNDARSPLTISKADGDFATQNLGPVDPASFAIPDKAEKVAARVAARQRSREAVLESMGFKKQASNALLVSGAESKTGNPMLLGGPQVGHAVPSFFMDLDVHAPGIDFRGPAVPGASVLIPLGRGRDYAWSLTTGYSDAVDTRAELLCDPKSGEPKLDSTGYMFKGECKEMKSRTETFEIKPPPTDPAPPSEEERTFYRTVHGPVFERATVDGKPVAFVKERFFWMKEVDSLRSFYEWNTSVRSIEDFAAAAKNFTMSFNTFYVDSEHIGYFHVGEYPLRTKGSHPSLPTWGTGEWEWKGRRSYSQQPKIIDPERGWVSNWNNKPARSWDNFDGFKWGSVHRMRLLADQMKALTAGNKKMELSDLVDVIRIAATQAGRGVYFDPKMVRKGKRATNGTPETAAAIKLVEAWIEKGAHRTNKDRDETMDDGAALAVFDAWYAALAKQVLGDELDEDAQTLMDAPITNYNPANGGGFWFDWSSYLLNLMGRKTRARTFPYNLCDDVTTETKETCAAQVQTALASALTQLTKDQGADMSKWTTEAENITFDELGAGSVSEIPWQNRGTENHVVEAVKDLGPGD
jgi:acyl-homoserine lactone acylase PvdQ